MKIRDVVRKKDRKPIAVDGHAPVSQAVAEMVASNVGSVLVLVDGVVEGIFTERDALKLWNQHGKVNDMAVMKFMTTNLIITNADETIENAMSVMGQKNIRHLIVVDGKKLLDVLSVKDLIKAYVGSLVANVQYMEKIVV